MHTGEDALSALEKLLPVGVSPVVWRLDDGHGLADQDEALSRIAGISGKETEPEISIIQAAPQNNVVYVLNKACVLMGRSLGHHGVLLQTAVGILSKRGYAHMELKLLDRYLDFTDKPAEDWTAAAAVVMAAVWFGKDRDRSMAEMIIKLELESYARSHRELNGYIGKIGFGCVILVARR